MTKNYEIADIDPINKETLSNDVWKLVLLSQQAKSLLCGAAELIGDASDSNTFNALQIIEVTIEKLSSITKEYDDLKIDDRLKGAIA